MIFMNELYALFFFCVEELNHDRIREDFYSIDCRYLHGWQLTFATSADFSLYLQHAMIIVSQTIMPT